MDNRDTIRSALLASPNRNPRSVTCGTVTVEMRDPTYADQQAAHAHTATPLKAIVLLITRCAYVPGTEVRVFTEADIPVLMEQTASGPLSALLTEMGARMSGAQAAGNAPGLTPTSDSST